MLSFLRVIDTTVDFHKHNYLDDERYASIILSIVRKARVEIFK